MQFSRWLDLRPLIVAAAGPNGAGESTFFHSHLALAGLPFINADQLALEFGCDAYQAAEIADALRRRHVAHRKSFVFETVLSDPVGDKIDFLAAAEQQGYTVALFFIGISSPAVSEERVRVRVMQGEHDVPRDKLRTRFPRTLRNLQRGITRLGHVLVLDNDDLNSPFRLVATFEKGKLTESHYPFPAWFKKVIKGGKRK